MLWGEGHWRAFGRGVSQEGMFEKIDRPVSPESA